MICSHYQKGQKLDVAGLNVVTVWWIAARRN